VFLGGRAPRSKISLYRQLFSDANVKRWYDNVARGSEITADVYLRRLGAFRNLNHLTPAELISRGGRAVEDLVMDYVTLNERKYAPSIKSTHKSAVSWLNFNNVLLQKKIKIRNLEDTPTLRDERVPSRPELQQILLSATKQSRVAIVLMAHAGLRLEVLGDYRGSDGLALGDLPG